MICRTVVLYAVVQSVVALVVVASPTVSQHGESIVSPFYRPTPASKARGMSEVGKIPRTAAAASKKLPAGGTPAKPNSGNYHSTRGGRNPIIIGPKPQRTRYNHLHLDESYQRPKTLTLSEEKAEKVNFDLEKLIQFVSLLGQIDRYLSSRAKSIVSTLSRAMETNTDDHQYSDKDTPPYDY